MDWVIKTDYIPAKTGQSFLLYNTKYMRLLFKDFCHAPNSNDLQSAILQGITFAFCIEAITSEIDIFGPALTSDDGGSVILDFHKFD